MTEEKTSASNDIIKGHQQMIDRVETAINELEAAIQNGEIEDPEKEAVRIKQFRTVGYLIRTKRQVIKDRTLEELAEEIEKMKNDNNQPENISIGSPTNQ